MDALGYDETVKNRLRKNIPPIPYSLDDLRKSQEIKEKTGVEEMLVLFVTDKDGKPLTMETMKERFDERYEALGLGKFLFHDSWSWFKTESFYKEHGLTFSWKLIGKQNFPNSMYKKHHDEPGDNFTHEETQAYAIEQFADSVGIPQEALHRPTPAELLFAIAVHLCTTKQKTGIGQRIFEREYHWSDVKTSGGHLVLVGDANSDGAYVNGRPRGHWVVWLGAALSRDPSFSESLET